MLLTGVVLAINLKGIALGIGAIVLMAIVAYFDVNS
jgi:hypothetical protein